MTAFEQNIAIAEACGWKSIIEDSTRPEGETVIGIPTWRPDCFRPIPSYTTDLNAMHESMKTMTPSQRGLFGGFLYTGKLCLFQDFCTGQMVFNFANTECSKLAEAFLRTIGKWKETSL